MVASTRVPVSYQLVIEVRSPVRCSVGRLGMVDFPSGTYVYTGSARRGFEARLARHVRATKTLRWHIDYLLARRLKARFGTALRRGGLSGKQNQDGEIRFE